MQISYFLNLLYSILNLIIMFFWHNKLFLATLISLKTWENYFMKRILFRRHCNMFYLHLSVSKSSPSSSTPWLERGSVAWLLPGLLCTEDCEKVCRGEGGALPWNALGAIFDERRAGTGRPSGESFASILILSSFLGFSSFVWNSKPFLALASCLTSSETSVLGGFLELDLLGSPVPGLDLMSSRKSSSLIIALPSLRACTFKC